MSGSCPQDAAGPEPDTIRSLVDAARAGDEDAFERLVRCFGDRLLRFLIAGGLTHADAEDVAQDAFVRAYRHLDRYDPRFAFSTWLFTIAHRLRCNHFRRQRPQVALAEAHAASAAPEDQALDPLADTIWATARAVLPPRQFDALWLRFGEELELDDVARVLGVRAGNARVLVHRARSRLAGHLETHRPDLVPV